MQERPFKNASLIMVKFTINNVNYLVNLGLYIAEKHYKESILTVICAINLIIFNS